MGMLPEEQLAVYLHMDMRIEAEKNSSGSSTHYGWKSHKHR